MLLCYEGYAMLKKKNYIGKCIVNVKESLEELKSDKLTVGNEEESMQIYNKTAKVVQMEQEEMVSIR